MSPRSLRLAYLSNFIARKLGTGEGRLIAFARGARARGHHLTVFGRTPVHREVEAALQDAGANWEPIDRLAQAPWSAGRDLAARFDVIKLNMVPPRSKLAFAANLAWPARVLFVDRVSGGMEEPPFNPASWLLDGFTMFRVSEVAGISEYVRARAARRFRLPPERTLVIHNGVDTDRFRPPARPLDQGPLMLVVVANLIPQKGVDVLLRAAARLPLDVWQLRVVGDGPEEQGLRRLAGELGIARRVEFTGLRDDVPDLLRDADIAVHPARWQEALGNTVLEAMATGLPVVASGTGGIPELLEDGVDGLLVPPGDQAALTGALERLVFDPALRARLGAAARSRVLRDFTLEASVARHLDWCERSASSLGLA